MPIITANVKSVYGKNWFTTKKILSNISFAINENDTIFMCGPSGIGKSTLLALLRGNQDCDGTITKKEGLQIRFVSQQLSINTKETVYDAIEYAVLSNDIYIRDPERRKKKVEYWLNAFNLTKCANLMISKLSGGEQRRVMLAERFAELEDYTLLIADEPDTGLDIRSQEKLHELMALNASKNGKALITVSHNVYPSNLKFYNKILLLGKADDKTATVRYFGDPRGLMKAFGTDDFLKIFDLLERTPHNPYAA